MGLGLGKLAWRINCSFEFYITFVALIDTEGATLLAEHLPLMSSQGNLLIDQSQWSTDHRLMNENICLAVSSQQNLFKPSYLLGIQKLSTCLFTYLIWNVGSILTSS